MKNKIKKWIFKKLFSDDVMTFSVVQFVDAPTLLQIPENRLDGFMNYCFSDLGIKLFEEMAKKGAIVMTKEYLTDQLAGEKITMKVNVYIK